MTVARLTVQRGDLTEFPLAERVAGGWQNGVIFYPDAEVIASQEVEVRAAREEHDLDELVGVLANALWMYGWTPLGVDQREDIDAEALDDLRPSIGTAFESNARLVLNDEVVREFITDRATSGSGSSPTHESGVGS